MASDSLGPMVCDHGHIGQHVAEKISGQHHILRAVAITACALSVSFMSAAAADPFAVDHRAALRSLGSPAWTPYGGFNFDQLEEFVQPKIELEPIARVSSLEAFDLRFNPPDDIPPWTEPVPEPDTPSTDLPPKMRVQPTHVRRSSSDGRMTSSAHRLDHRQRIILLPKLLAPSF